MTSNMIAIFALILALCPVSILALDLILSKQRNDVMTNKKNFSEYCTKISLVKNKMNSQVTLNPSRIFYAIKWQHIAGFVSFLLGLSVLIPRMTLDVGQTDVRRNVFTTPFVLTNTGYMPIGSIMISLSYCEIGEPVLPPEGDCDYSHPASITPITWKRPILRMDERYTISLNDVIRFEEEGQPETADIGILVSYSPWILPIALHRVFRFRTTMGADGYLKWFSDPV